MGSVSGIVWKRGKKEGSGGRIEAQKRKGNPINGENRVRRRAAHLKRRMAVTGKR